MWRRARAHIPRMLWLFPVLKGACFRELLFHALR
jgi:hypothetical protein